MSESGIVINITMPPMPKADDYTIVGSGGDWVEVNKSALYEALDAWRRGVESIGKGLANIKAQNS